MKKIDAAKTTKTEETKVDAAELANALKVKSEIKAGFFVVKSPGGGGCRTCGLM